jgi:tetratricopeptide (TPR) repeat protein
MKFQPIHQLKRYLALTITVAWLVIFSTSALAISAARGTAAGAGTPAAPLQRAQSTDPAELVRQGRVSYQNGDYGKAIASWQTALAIYSERRDSLNEAMLLSNLALAQQRLGQWQEANSKISASLSLLQNQSSSATHAYWQGKAQALNRVRRIKP